MTDYHVNQVAQLLFVKAEDILSGKFVLGRELVPVKGKPRHYTAESVEALRRKLFHVRGLMLGTIK